MIIVYSYPFGLIFPLHYSCNHFLEKIILTKKKAVQFYMKGWSMLFLWNMTARLTISFVVVSRQI